jgi:hypothetical protein
MTDRAELTREQFEAWARSKGHYLGRGWNEDYGSAITRSDWALWQAATQAQAERIAALEAKLAAAEAEVAELSGRGTKRDLKPGDCYLARVRYRGRKKPTIYPDDESAALEGK